MTILFPLLVSLVGVLMYALCTDAKLSTIGLNMFWTGLLAFMLLYRGGSISLP